MRAMLLALMMILLTGPFEAVADAHYFSLKKVFPDGKCSPIIPHFEAMKAGFTGGEITRYKIYDAQGRMVEVISSFISKDRDQWALVGSKTDTRVIFCLYASGTGSGSVDSQAIRLE